MFGRVNFWRIAESKLVDEKVWKMDRLSHTISEIWMALFGESQTICQTFPPKDTAYFARNHCTDQSQNVRHQLGCYIRMYRTWENISGEKFGK